MKRKIWLAPLALVGLTAPAVLSASCGNNGDKNGSSNINSALLKNGKSAKDLFNIDNFNKKPEGVNINFPDFDAKLGVANLFQDGAYSDSSFDIDTTSEYGTYNGYIYESAVGYLVRKQNLFEPIVETKREGKSSISYVIKRPSIWKYKLGYIAKVIVTKADGNVEEFDNDYVNTFPDYDDKVNKTFNSLKYQAVAKDDSSNQLAQRSINGEHFFKSLKGATQVRFAIKKGYKWVDSNGNETKYEIVPEDFYLSYVRTFLLNQGYRKKALKKALPTLIKTDTDFNNFDAEANSFLSSGSTYFTSQSRYPNYYLWDLYGYKSKDFLDESKFLTDYNGEKVLTFNASGTVKPGGDLLFDAIASIKDFNAFPSQYVRDNAATPKFTKLSDKSDADLDKFLQKLKQIPVDNLISRTGTYWYGTGWKNMLFAGPYYYTGYHESTQKTTWKINKHFWDQDFVNGNVVKQIDQRYQNNTDKDQFFQQIFADYKLGKAYTLRYANLAINQRNEINGAPNKFGVSYAKTRNWNNLALRLQFRGLPGDVKPGNDIIFNDVFAKFFYGDGSTSNKTVGDIKGKANYESLIGGYGLPFRSIITAAYNWQSSASFVSNNKKQAWIASVAPDGKINGSDAKQDNSNLISTYSKEINSLWALNPDLTKFDLGGGKTEISPDDNIKAAVAESGDSGKLKASHYSELQKAMTALIDDFYAKHPTYDPKTRESDKLSFGYPWFYTNWGVIGYETLWGENGIKKIIEGLDTRGRLKVNMIKYDEADTDNRKFAIAGSYGNSIFNFGSWSYDYDGIGSGFDGLASSTLLGRLLMIGQSTTLQNKLKVSFPEIVKASKSLVEFINKGVTDHKFTLSVPLDKIFDAPSKTVSRIYSNFENWILDGSDIKVDDDVSHGTALSLMTSFFWLDYSSKITNKENIDLVHEFSVFNPPVVDSQRVYSQQFTPRVSNPHFRTPFSGSDQAWFEDIRIWQ